MATEPTSRPKKRRKATQSVTEAVSAKPARNYSRGRSQLSPEQRDQIRSLSLVLPPLTESEIADKVGCSRFAVRHLRSLSENTAEKALKFYGKRLSKELPLSERVKAYAELARGNIDAKRAFSALKALQRIEELEGIVTKKEQKEAESRDHAPAPSAVFVIQGAQINVGPDSIPSLKPLASAKPVAALPATELESIGSVS